MGNSFSANSVYNYISQIITLYDAASNPHHSYDDTDNIDTCDVDKALVSQLKKSIMRLFNTYGTLVYNEKENTVYKKIENKYDAHIYRYYSNGAVYLVNYGRNNKKKESVALCDSIIYCNIAVFLDPYNIPLKMQKLINDNKDKVIENQKNEAIKKKQNKIKKTIKESSDKQLNDPYSNIKNFLCFNKDAEFFHNYNNSYNDFIKFQAKKWYGKEININITKKSVFFTKIFPPNMYKIYEALNKLNDSYNTCVGKNEIINTFYYKDSVYGRYGHKIYEAINIDELGFPGDTHCFYYSDDYLDNTYFSIIKVIDDIMKKIYNQGNFEKMFYAINNREQVKRFWGDRYNGVFGYGYNFNTIIDDDIKDKEAAIKDLILPDNIVKPVSLFLDAKNKDHFEKMVNDYCSSDRSSYSCMEELLKNNNAIKLDDIKMTSYLIAYSNEINKDRYQYRYIRVNNYIPNPALHFFCAAYKNFVEQVKACEFGEEWLKFRGFIAPDPPVEKKSSKKTKTKTKKGAKKND